MKKGGSLKRSLGMVDPAITVTQALASLRKQGSKKNGQSGFPPSRE
jgi:hypothetical protein